MVIMQARSSTTGAIITWLAAGPDFAAVGFPGPGSAIDVAVLAQDVYDGGITGLRGGVKRPIFGELQTAAAGASGTPLATFAMADESVAAFDVMVTMARRTNVTKAAAYKRAATYRRTGGAAPVLVGSAPAPVDQETTAGDDVAFVVSGNSITVVCTAADTDPRNWTCELRVQETRAT